MIFVPFATRAENENSQTLPLLQASVSPLSIATKSTESTTDTTISSDALKPNTSQMLIAGGTEGDVSAENDSVYVVREGDKISDIAKMFGVSVNTILWANDMKKSDKLVPGTVLLVLPVDGVEHTILKGQTLKGIAAKYKVDVENIAGFNGISPEADLITGETLIIPDATMSTNEGNSKPNPKNSTKNKDYYIKHPSKDLGGYFVNPVPAYKYKSQGIHGKNGVDLAAPTGTPTIAAASGTVIFARNGWNGAYGNLVIIRHPNGVETLYAHLSKISTRSGAKVEKGEIIGYVGSTGRSTGPHLHFEVKGAKNFTNSL